MGTQTVDVGLEWAHNPFKKWRKWPDKEHVTWQRAETIEADLPRVTPRSPEATGHKGRSTKSRSHFANKAIEGLGGHCDEFVSELKVSNPAAAAGLLARLLPPNDAPENGFGGDRVY